MPINESNKQLLESYGITLKKELKGSSVLQLNGFNKDTKISKSLYEVLLSALSKADTKKHIDLPDITFGIEFEFVGSYLSKDLSEFNKEMSRLLHDKYIYLGEYTHNDGDCYILGRDGSIRYRNSYLPQPFGYELSTPKLNFNSEDDIATLSKVISLIEKHLKGYVNQSCGTHIHIGFKSDNVVAGSVRNTLSAYNCMEKRVFDTIVPTSRRRNKYCKPTSIYLHNKYQKLSSRFCEFNYNGSCKKLHFEFRQLEGTLNLNLILNWARLQSYILYDLLTNASDTAYLSSVTRKNIFEILTYYDLDPKLISFFIARVISFRSRALQSS